jgi:hypothetical protein
MYIWSMDDNGNIWYYLVLGVIYLLSRVFGKKKKRQPKPQPDASPQREITPPTAEKEDAPAMSFEDILKELAGGQKPTPDPITEPEPEPIIQPAYSMDDIDEIAVDYDVPDAIGANPYYQEPPKSVASTRIQDKFQRADHYKIEKRAAIDYTSIFSEDGGPAKAFVLSEIFERKY